MSKQTESTPQEARRGVIVRTDGTPVNVADAAISEAQRGLSTTKVDIMRQV